MNPFLEVFMDIGDEKFNSPTKFMSTLYNLGFFQHIDVSNAIELIMDLEDILDGTRCLR